MKARQLDAATIRAVHPRAGSKADYCVGAAFLRYLDAKGGVRDYPEPHQIADGLRSVNPALTKPQAHARAAWVTRFNDTRQVNKAWAALDRALAYPEKPSTP